MTRVAVALAVALRSGPALAHELPERTADLRVEVVARGLDDPLYLTAPPGDARRFVVEQAGRIRIIKDGHLLATPFLDLRDSVGAGGERGAAKKRRPQGRRAPRFGSCGEELGGLRGSERGGGEHRQLGA